MLLFCIRLFFLVAVFVYGFLEQNSLLHQNLSSPEYVERAFAKTSGIWIKVIGKNVQNRQAESEAVYTYSER